jgi:hypothetical protein
MLILIAVIITIGVTMFALAACLPLLMGITLVHAFRSHDDAVDSSIIFTQNTTQNTEDLDPHQNTTAWRNLT